MFRKNILKYFTFVAVILMCCYKEGESRPNNSEVFKGVTFIYGMRAPNNEKLSNRLINWAANQRNTRQANHGVIIDYDDDYSQHGNDFERGPYNHYELANNHGKPID